MSPHQKICKILLTVLEVFHIVTIAIAPLNTLRDHPHFLVDFILDVIKGITGNTQHNKVKKST